MRTITIELPDTTPLMALMEFSAQIGCDMKLVEHNRFRFEKTPNPNNVVRMPARVRDSASRAVRKV